MNLIYLILASSLFVGCGEAEFSTIGALSSLSTNDEATPGQVNQVIEQINRELGENRTAPLPEEISEIITPEEISEAPTPEEKKVKKELSKPFVCKKKLIKTEDKQEEKSLGGPFVRVGDGSFLQDSSGSFVKSGYHNTYMICKINKEGRQKTVCLTKKELKKYQSKIDKGIADGYLGPCKDI